MKGTEHKSQLNRLKRIEGQVRGISKMIEEHRYCLDIVTQIKAIKSALSSVESHIVENHLDHCVHDAITLKKPAEVEEKLAEIKELLKSARK